MIIDTLTQADRYLPLNCGFAAAFAFLRRPDLAALDDGRYEINGKQVYATISRQSTRPPAGAQLEAHRRYIDIHYLLAGVEQIGWKSTPDCQQPATDYDQDRDMQFFADPADTWVSISAGQFAVVFCPDAHIPLVGTGDLHKIVVKVAVDCCSACH